jgi:hypothetical protein
MEWMCPRCAGSPLCDRCGHPRGDHAHVFVRGGLGGCRREVGDFQSLTHWTCDCAGFRPVAGGLRDATFAGTDNAPAPLPPLRLARQSSSG